jgi:tight adherence protein B
MSSLMPVFFILGLLAISSGTLALALTRTRATRRELDRRTSLVMVNPDDEAAAASIKRIAAATNNLFVQNIFAVGLRYRWGMTSGATVLLMIAVVSAVAAWLLIHSFLHFSALIAFPVTAVIAMLGPRQLLKRQQARAERLFLDLFPATIDMIVRMVRAGLTIVAAMRLVGNEAPPPINKVFTALADRVEIGVPLNEALRLEGERIGLSDFRFFAVAVSLQYATGGNVAATLEILSDIVRKRRGARLKATSTTAEVRVSAMLLGSLPFVVIGGLLLVSPAYLAPLVTDPRGNIIVGMAIILLLSGFGVMRVMMRRATRY